MTPPMSDATASAAIEGATHLELVLPADPQLLRIVRLVASGLASLADLDLDGVEQVRVAADELVSTLIEAGSGDPISVRFDVTAEALTIEATTPLPSGTAFTVDPMADRVLDAVASHHAWSSDDGVAQGRVERSRSTV